MKDFIKVLLRFVPPYKKQLWLSILYNIISGFLNVFSFSLIIPILQILFKINEKVYGFIAWNTPGVSFKDMAINNFYWYISSMIDNYSGSFTLFILGLFLTVMTFFKTGTAYLSLYYMTPLRTGVVRDIRNQLYGKIIQLPLSFFSEERKGDIIARMSGDVNEVENSVITSLDMLFKNPILIIIYMTTMIMISWQLTLFVLILLPVAGFIMGRVGKTLKRTTTIGQEQWSNLMTQLEETLGGLRIIKAFNAEQKMKNRFESTADTFRKTNNRINQRYQLAHPMSEFLGTVTIAIVLWFGGTLILHNNSSIDASAFIFYLVIFYSLINPAKEFSKASYSIKKGLASMERVDKILLSENNLKQPDHPVKINTFNKEIELRGVWFKYQKDWVLKNINLTIPKGKTIALVGQSGSGKSTLVDMIPRFYDVQKGEVLIDGVNVKDATFHDVRSIMGIVNQEAVLFNDTFKNNIAFGVENATPEQIREAAKIANAHDFIMATENGYDTMVGDRGGKLSGGQRQRISIARAILKNPPILILDEATSALDTESEKMVQEALEHLMKNRTTIAIAHRLSTIRNADEICVLYEGEIVERGKHEELIAKDGFYKKLSDLQQF
ncbi:MAG: ABC transporter ATP-binding protein/permease [Candidatus Azobacteroides sp.]|nr:ABC transporter ATP-binding protein/permease [Candidatus Azobacteroides sp.]